MDYSRLKNSEKAIFAVREIVCGLPIYQTRGMACAVDVGGKQCLLTWEGVFKEDDRALIESVKLHRCSRNFHNDEKRYRLEISAIKQAGSCSFISVKALKGSNTSETLKTTTDSNIFQLIIPRSDDVIDRDVWAQSFIGSNKPMKFKFKYNREKKKHELNSFEGEKCIIEKSVVLGSPIITTEGVIGVVGEDVDGQPIPYFITQTELGHRDRDPSESENGEEKKKILDDLDSAGSTGQTAKNFKQLKDAINDKSKRGLEELKNAVSGIGFVISDNEGKGNCLFHALCEQLEIVKRISIKHDELRQTLVQYLTENPNMEDGTCLFSLLESSQRSSFVTWDNYLRDMAKDGTWGDEMIIIAAANYYKTIINVIRALPGAPDNRLVYPIKPECEVEGGHPVWLGHIYNFHFVSLLKAAVAPSDQVMNGTQQKECQELDKKPGKLVSGHGKTSSSTETVPALDSTEKIRSGKVPPEWFPYLALDMEGKVKWKTFGKSLNLTDADIQSIDKDNNEEYERYYNMLKTWWQRGDASCDNLAFALKDLESIRDDYCLMKQDPPVKKKVELPRNLKEGPIDDKALQAISHAVKGKRKRLGRALGLRDDRLDDIEEENPKDAPEQSYQILRAWRNAKGKNASYYALAQALYDRTVNLSRVVMDLCLKKHH